MVELIRTTSFWAHNEISLVFECTVLLGRRAKVNLKEGDESRSNIVWIGVYVFRALRASKT